MYVCKCFFEQRFDELKEYTIGLNVFDRPETFDPANDSIVRVEAYRLRRKLREFYDGEGASEPVEILLPIGQYRPEFRPRTQVEEPPQSTSEAFAHGAEDMSGEIPVEDTAAPDEPAKAEPQLLPFSRGNRPDRLSWMWFPLGFALLCVCCWTFLHARGNRDKTAHLASALSPVSAVPVANAALMQPAPGSEPAIRIRCGYTKPSYRDSLGNVWMGDRYFAGGNPADLPNQYVARTRDPNLYLSLRSGTFTYNIPASPGTYELRLYFAETTYTPSSPLGGGENSRVFDVRLNGDPLLTEFDIAADAGPGTADVRVFKDVHPDRSGMIHLGFSGRIGLPILNAIELVPGTPHATLPIRMVAQNSSYTDAAGRLWSPDEFVEGGQLAQDKSPVAGTKDPDLYAGERYGNFTYAFPVDTGRYAVTLHFSENYWGTAYSGMSGPGRRVFDVFCNGVALVRNFDIAQEVGSDHALQMTYHGLVPNAQGKLLLSFVPVRNYAAVDAIQVEAEP